MAFAGLNLEAARRVEVKLQAQRSGTGEAEHYRFAPRGRETFFERLAHKLGAVAIGKNKPHGSRDDIARKVRRDREIEPVAEGTIVPPFAIALIVEQAGLDFDDGDVARARQRDNVRAPSIGE